MRIRDLPTLVNVDSGEALYWPPAISGVGNSLPWLCEIDAAAQIGDRLE
jgi:hypothetical protein